MLRHDIHYHRVQVGLIIISVIEISQVVIVDGIQPHRWDLAGVGLMLAGMAVIMFAPR